MSFITYSMANALLRGHKNVFPYLAPGIKHVQQVNVSISSWNTVTL